MSLSRWYVFGRATAFGLPALLDGPYLPPRRGMSGHAGTFYGLCVLPRFRLTEVR